MAPRASSRRLSLDMLQRAVSDVSAELDISKYMDLRLPSTHTAPSSAGDVSKVQCECCGLSEECTPTYIKRVKARFCDTWVCGLCAEAVKEELKRRGSGKEKEALSAHMEVCRKFNRFVRVNPAMSVAGAMTEILKKGSQGNYKNKNKMGVNGFNCKIERTRSCVPMVGRGK